MLACFLVKEACKTFVYRGQPEHDPHMCDNFIICI